MDVWKASQDEYDLLEHVIRQYHLEKLSELMGRFEIIFKEKAGISGGRVQQAKLRKAGKDLKTLADNDAMYVLEIAADEWQSMDTKDRTALIDHHLCSIHVTEKPDTSERSYRIVPPDFVGYRSEIERWGVWRYLNREDEEGDAVIDNLFGNAPANQEDDDDAPL